MLRIALLASGLGCAVWPVGPGRRSRHRCPPAVPVPPVPGVPAPTAGAASSAASTSYNEPVETDAHARRSRRVHVARAARSGLGLMPSEPGRRAWASGGSASVQPFAGIETLFLAPIHNTGGGGANYTFSDPTATTSYTASSGNGMVATPRIWLGLMGQRWGIGVRYWGFSNDPGGGQFPDSPTSQGVFSQGVLKLQTFDFEAIRRFQFDNHQIWFTVGLRASRIRPRLERLVERFFQPRLVFRLGQFQLAFQRRGDHHESLRTVPDSVRRTGICSTADACRISRPAIRRRLLRRVGLLRQQREQRP